MAHFNTASSRTVGGLHSRVLNSVGADIVSGQLPPGFILNLDEMSAEFDVSRSVLRESIRVLQSLGLVEARQRVGTVVLPWDSWDLFSPQIIFWRGQGPGYYTQMRELLQLRLGIEPIAARLSAAHMTATERRAVCAAADTMDDANRSGDGKVFLEADVAFHTLVLRSSGNAVMAHFAGTVEAVLRTREQERRYTITTYTSPSVDRHHALAAALAESDADGAQRASYAILEATVKEFSTAPSETKDRVEADSPG
ncbi:FadR/GntR family transcriptional regulator [Subtercola frigoramans]|uniref:DNA-binding FadR family transcriptional regulator n=1 Tax=Subtercola frigoramans TaxID=120298 RepID=A0ABS2L6K0_9MICO|nr:FCD domain-containing protein [Subtercola frigoramans]MBM7472697.1 DNA-binding FadR family transcriptional regulator [Subtercola frigoramans]